MKRTERGSITAEFAVLLPALLFIVVVLLQIFQMVAQQQTLRGNVAQAVRVLVISGQEQASRALMSQHPDARITIRQEGGLWCLSASSDIAILAVARFSIGAKSCAAA